MEFTFNYHSLSSLIQASVQEGCTISRLVLAQQAAQAAQAKITKAEAIAAAQAANPGWNFSKSELDSENGTILYELKGTDVNGQKQNIHVNAMDGTIVQETADHE